ncbi:MAG: hypothetical protein FD180_1851 [Planctomycetota bacterium]|nr:MAG: hypothetical protein FD180_1851 [Planctomycetota bacterium]
MSDTSSITRRTLFGYNAASALVLMTGFINTLLVPRLAIQSMGIEAYGHYVLLAGFAIIPTIADLGLMPSFTAAVGRLVAGGGGPAVARLRIKVLGVCISLAIVLALAVPLIGQSWGGFFQPIEATGVLLGGLANVSTLAAEILLVSTRVAGRIVPAALSKSAYFAANVASVSILASSQRLTAPALFACQLGSSIAYAALALLLLRGNSDRGGEAADVPTFRSLFPLALPEQIGRVQAALLPSIERSILNRFGGASFLASYDVALRLTLVVTALPGALSEPLLTLLAPRRGEENRAERKAIMSHAFQLSVVLTILMLTIVLWPGISLAGRYYGLARDPLFLLCVVMTSASAVNILTAPVSASLYAAGRRGAMLAKSCADGASALAGIAAGVCFGSARLAVVVRSTTVAAGALGLLVWFRFKGGQETEPGKPVE